MPWADIAKAFSMIFLVAWTLVGSDVHFNEMLIFLRMPLFFFVSGLFAWRVVTRTTLREVLRDKVTNLLFLYFVWESLLFLFRNVPQHFLSGRRLSLERQLSLFWDPIFNIWFLYALAIAVLAAFLLRRVPVWIVLAGSVGLYLWSIASQPWEELTLIHRLIRLFPFFWLGLMLRPVLGPVVEASYRAWPLVVAAFLAAAYFAWDSPAARVGLLTFAVTVTGIAGLLLLSRQVAEVPPLARALSYIGGSTLYIYVLHKIAIFYLETGLQRTGLGFQGQELLLLAVVVPLCAVIGRWAADQPGLRHAFAAPWVLRKAPRRRLVPAE